MVRRREEEIPEYIREFRCALLKGIGLTDEQLKKPMIGVVNEWGELTPSTIHLNRVAKAAKAGINAAGCTSIEFSISATCGGMRPPATASYSTLIRDIIPAYIEHVNGVFPLDAMVFVTVCDENIPGNLMAAARINIPSIVVTGGYMHPRRHKGREILISDVVTSYGKLKSGETTEDEFRVIRDTCCTGSGSCPGMFTANAADAVAEALGVALPGNTTIPGTDPRLVRLAYNAGTQVVSLLEKGIKPSDIMTKDSFFNAVKVLLALGGQTNVVTYLQAIAAEAGLDLDLETFDKLGRETRFICNVVPAGKYNLWDLDEAGGIPAVMKELSPILNLNVMTATGRTLGENLKDVQVLRRDVIYSFSSPIAKEGGIAVLKGSLAPRGAIINQVGVPLEMLKHRGPAKPFNDEEEACVALLNNEIKAGDVVVFRYMGPKGGPGMKTAAARFLWLLAGKNLLRSVPVVTDGRISGTNVGCAVVHVSPEAAEGGPIALVEEGDTIEIDIPSRKLNVEVSDAEIQRRMSMWKAPEARYKGFLAIYTKVVQPSDKGAILRP